MPPSGIGWVRGRHDRRRGGDLTPLPHARSAMGALFPPRSPADGAERFRHGGAVRGAGGKVWALRYASTPPSTRCWRPSPRATSASMLTLATGTGRRPPSRFQIAWKPFHARWNPLRSSRCAGRASCFVADGILAGPGHSCLLRLSADAIHLDRPGRKLRKKGGASGRTPACSSRGSSRPGSLTSRRGHNGSTKLSPDFFDFVIITTRCQPRRRAGRKQQLARHRRIISRRRFRSAS